ncbi:MAG: phosphoglycerate kinase [Candidatus Heimdallarchaeaceae archaeon]
MLINNPTKKVDYAVRDLSNILKFREKKFITDLDVFNKRVLVRVDYNVPLDKNGIITDTRRIANTLPTLNYLLKQNCRIILISHLGRPNGKIVESLRMDPIHKKLKEFFPETNVYKVEDCIGKEVVSKVSKLKNKEILLLENPRFHKEEKENDPEFAAKLAKLADVYVDDAFATAHRKHASTYGVCSFFKDKGYGFLVEKELKFLSSSIEKPQRPFTVILGGKKVKDKLGVIKNLIGLADNILIGGGMAYTFLLAKGYQIGKSVKDLSKLKEIRDYLRDETHGTRIFIPKDVLVCDEIENPRKIKIVPVTEIGENDIGVDIGPETIKIFNRILAESKQVVWNGPMGVFEQKEFENGTKEIARYLAESDIVTIIGGGDSAAAIEKFDYQDNMSFISTGGGASLDVMRGAHLPAIDCLSDK